MLSKKMISCLDVRCGKIVKGIKFKENVDIFHPREMAGLCYERGAYEVVFYDIKAYSYGRDI